MLLVSYIQQYFDTYMYNLLLSQFWQIRFESMTDCTVQSAEYWCSYSTYTLDDGWAMCL